MGNSRKKRAAKWVAMKKAGGRDPAGAGTGKYFFAARESDGDIKMWVTYCHTEKRNIGEPTPDYNTAEANTEVHIQTTNPNHDAETIAGN
jgi:hypothetical protein